MKVLANKGWALAAAGVAMMLVVACGSGTKAKPPLEPSNDSVPGSEEASADGGAGAGSAEGDGGAGATPAAALQGNEEGAQALLKQFVAPNADHAALTRSLRPTTADYKSLFDAPTAAKVESFQAKDWDSNRAVIQPKPNQTEVKLWSASGADLAAGKGAAKEFPGGYKKLGKHLAAGVTFYRFKFVEAGKDVGTAYDGLAFVNGHWVIASKPWKAIDGGKGDEPDETDAKPAKPAKKQRPKKK